MKNTFSHLVNYETIIFDKEIIWKVERNVRQLKKAL